MRQIEKSVVEHDLRQSDTARKSCTGRRSEFQGSCVLAITHGDQSVFSGSLIVVPNGKVSPLGHGRTWCHAFRTDTAKVAANSFLQPASRLIPPSVARLVRMNSAGGKADDKGGNRMLHQLPPRGVEKAIEGRTRQAPMSGRIVHAIRIHFGGLSDQSIIIWPNRLPDVPCARLLNSQKNWMTAGRDDIVMLTTD